MHRPVRRYALACTAAFGLFAVAGCGGEDEPPKAVSGQEILLQPVAAAGPDPFTASTATSMAALPPPAHPGNPATEQRGRPGPGAAGSEQAPALRAVTGSTPGLYGGTHKRGSCDVEQQVKLFAGDRDRARAFAGAAGIESGGIEEFLRALTPVVLRADTRVTNHGFRGGRAAAYQSVLQAGTAVLVDDYGLPRVRCACGNPLMPPVEGRGGSHAGTSWPGFQPSQVVVVKPTDEIVDNLVIVNISNNTWIERRTGDDGAQDTVPADPPLNDPSGPVATGPAAPRSAAPATPSDPCATSPNSLARTAPPQAADRAPGGSVDRPAPCPPTGTGPDAPAAPGNGNPDRLADSPGGLSDLPGGGLPGDVSGDLSGGSSGDLSGDLSGGLWSDQPADPDYATGTDDPFVDPFADSDTFAAPDPFAGSDGFTESDQFPDYDRYTASDQPFEPDPSAAGGQQSADPQDLYGPPDGGVPTDPGTQLESA